MLAPLALLGTSILARPENPLLAYVNRPDSAYRYAVQADPRGGDRIEMVSQVWQGTTWRHEILVRQPTQAVAPGVAILYITGDGPRPGDFAQMSMLTAATGMPVATLFSIPNQPIEGRREDDLIAHTFEKYLATRDASWPLLFPMVKGAVRAMDAVVDATKGSANPIKKFVVTGASKRGWTTWLVGALGDPRVLGIAPMVIDNLNVRAQMKNQLKVWGKYSEQIDDYTRRGLQAKMDTFLGRQLTDMVDPYTYRRDIKVPTLILKGANDRYWAVDALDQYWRDLKMPKWIMTVPNVGHDLGGGLQAIESVGGFARSLAGGSPMPKLSWNIRRGMVATEARAGSGYGMPTRTETPDGSYFAEFSSGNLAPFEVKAWIARSDSLDFRDSKYVPDAVMKLEAAEQSKGARGAVRGILPTDKNAAVFLEFRYRVGGRAFSLSSNTMVFKQGETSPRGE